MVCLVFIGCDDDTMVWQGSALRHVLYGLQGIDDLAIMKQINGVDAIRLAQEVSKLSGGSFDVSFYPYNRTKDQAGDKLTVKKGCTFRSQLPQDKFSVDGDNYFLFNDADGNEKTSYRILTRLIAFPPEFEMRKINWL